MYSLKDCLTRGTDDFRLPRLPCDSGALYYQDNGCNVLGVAHLDYVQYANPIKRGDYIFAPQLDDRLGVWILLNLLPSLGVDLDILLTDKEEVGQTTARDFYPDKEYNWVIEFDRAGSDIVFYQYKEFSDVWPIEEGGGSFTDISELEHLGVLCANIGIGYYKQHTRDCYAHLPTTVKQVKKFIRFYNKYKDTRFPFVPECHDYYSDSSEIFDGMDDYGCISGVIRNDYYSKVIGGVKVNSENYGMEASINDEDYQEDSLGEYVFSAINDRWERADRSYFDTKRRYSSGFDTRLR